MSQLNVLLPNKYNKKEMDSRKNLSLHNNLLSQVSLPNKSLDSMYLFNKQVKPRGVVTNQYSSGRCWLFAGHWLNNKSTIPIFHTVRMYTYTMNYDCVRYTGMVQVLYSTSSCIKLLIEEQ